MIAVVEAETNFSFEQMAREAPWGMVICDREGHTMWFNHAFSKMCGYTIKEMLGKKPGALLQGPRTDRSTARILSKAICDGKPCDVVILNYGKDGRTYWADIHMLPVRDNAGNLNYYFAVIHEVSEQVQQQKALEEFVSELYTINSLLVDGDRAPEMAAR